MFQSEFTMDENKLTEMIIGAAMRVHSELGPGLLESAYEHCLVYELQELNLKVERQKQVPIHYRTKIIDAGYRIDILVEDSILVELKAVEKMERIHYMQVLSYLRLSKLHLGLLINFNTTSLRYGIKRIVN
jgi:GxxExxY protein